MRINVELDEEETALLLLMLGAGTGTLHTPLSKIDNMLSLVNKLMKDNPHFTPYAVQPGQKVP